ncbi:MAG: hypothetical protein UR78_C0004G0038 [Candidatus Moranbacteria bacterium GW2011_GWF2_35_39]|nr:MAG: hypothetical protein UR78_C0004G0038 [Candidatus Moranbacteria bacterium GW2011_GWF2_35_39]
MKMFELLIDLTMEGIIKWEKVGGYNFIAHLKGLDLSVFRENVEMEEVITVGLFFPKSKKISISKSRWFLRIKKDEGIEEEKISDDEVDDVFDLAMTVSWSIDRDRPIGPLRAELYKKLLGMC